VYIGGWDNYVYCFDASTGEKVWTYQTNNHVNSSPTVVGDTVFVGSWDHDLYAFGVPSTATSQSPSPSPSPSSSTSTTAQTSMSPTPTETPTAPQTLPIEYIYAIVGVTVVLLIGLAMVFRRRKP
jgi:outer membrane protein assembly factor BamB